MQYYRCKCGSRQSWTSMGVAACASCDKCGSDLAQGPTEHSEPEAHHFVKQYDQNTGEPYEICHRCMTRQPHNPVP